MGAACPVLPSEVGAKSIAYAHKLICLHMVLGQPFSCAHKHLLIPLYTEEGRPMGRLGGSVG